MKRRGGALPGCLWGRDVQGNRLAFAPGARSRCAPSRHRLAGAAGPCGSRRHVMTTLGGSQASFPRGTGDIQTAVVNLVRRLAPVVPVMDQPQLAREIAEVI